MSLSRTDPYILELVTDHKKAVYLEKANAKINLFLDVKERRQDGFHNIETLFQSITLADHITCEILVDTGVSNQVDFEISLDSNSEAINALAEKNLIVKAIEYYFAELPDSILNNVAQVKISVFVDKNIPMSAGLGGGSSNAAATLRILNKFFHENFSFEYPKEKILELALAIGSDVPFCYLSDASPRIYAEARGEKFLDLQSSQNEILTKFDFDKFSRLIIVKPSFGVSTKEAYDLVSSANAEEHQLEHGFYNKFEEAVFAKYPEIKEIKENLLQFGCNYAMMSGSGSTVLGFVKDEQQLEEVYKKANQSLKNCELVVKSEFA